MKLKHFITANVITAIACISLIALWTFVPNISLAVDRIAKSVVFFIMIAHNIITTEYIAGKMNISKNDMKPKILLSLSITLLTIMALTVIVGLMLIDLDSNDNMAILFGGMMLFCGIPIEAVILIILIIAFQVIKKKHKNKDEGL